MQRGNTVRQSACGRNGAGCGMRYDHLERSGTGHASVAESVRKGDRVTKGESGSVSVASWTRNCTCPGAESAYSPANTSRRESTPTRCAATTRCPPRARTRGRSRRRSRSPSGTCGCPAVSCARAGPWQASRRCAQSPVPRPRSTPCTLLEIYVLSVRVVSTWRSRVLRNAASTIYGWGAEA